jgi:hypothetical protein
MVASRSPRTPIGSEQYSSDLAGEEREADAGIHGGDFDSGHGFDTLKFVPDGF